MQEGTRESIFHDKNHEHFVLYKGTEIIGYAHLELCLDDRATIHGVVMTESDHHKKYEEMFMQLIEKWLKIKGYKDIQLQDGCTRSL